MKVSKLQLESIIGSNGNSLVNTIMEFHLTNNTSVMDSILHLSQKDGIEVEAYAAAVMNSPRLLEMITREAEELKFIPVTERLPIELED